MEQEKVYLKTIEEVSDALAAGKVVYDKYEVKIWKDKNGFVICKSKNGDQYLKISSLCIEDDPYILEPKPLEVKLWHLYENGRGEIVFIGYKHEDPDGKLVFDGLNKTIGLQRYIISGKTICEGHSIFDLVKELADLSKYFEKEPDDAKND